MPFALRLGLAAQSCFAKMGADNGLRLVLSLFFKAVVGIPRIFHFETLNDPGFAILTGGNTVLTRHTLGSLVRRVAFVGVQRFMKLTGPRVKKAERHTVSIDEHAIARFTRKFSIRKGFHTIRNKHMKIEKLSFAYHTGAKQLLSLIASRGHECLKHITERLLPSLRRRARGAQLRLILDAGAAKNHAQLFALAQHERQVTIVRVPRRPSYLKQWQLLSADQWRQIQEPGPYTKAPPKIVHVADTVMTLLDTRTNTLREVRTIVVREQTTRGKDRWHALWVFQDDDTDRWAIVQEYRTRQHHEQTYRVLVHDVYIDTASSGYDKNSTNPAKPGFKQNALTLYAWTAALANHALSDFAAKLPKAFHRAHPRTLRRWFLNTSAGLYLGQGTLIVMLQPRFRIQTWDYLIHYVNRGALRIPWLDNRRLVLSLDHHEMKRSRKLELIRE